VRLQGDIAFWPSPCARRRADTPQRPQRRSVADRASRL